VKSLFHASYACATRRGRASPALSYTTTGNLLGAARWPILPDFEFWEGWNFGPVFGPDVRPVYPSENSVSPTGSGLRHGAERRGRTVKTGRANSALPYNGGRELRSLRHIGEDAECEACD